MSGSDYYKEPGCDDSAGAAGWQVDTASTEGVCILVESTGWELQGPHESLRACMDYIAGVCEANGGPEAATLADSLRGAGWNRILARNAAYTEGTIRLMLDSVRETANLLTHGQELMAEQTVGWFFQREVDGIVGDGMPQ